MTLGAGALLKLLGSGAGLAARAFGGGAQAPIEGASFAELLERASRGTLRASEPVRIEAGAGVSLTNEQMTRVGEAASRLEAAGASRGVILVDDLALEFDVLTRTITGTVDLSNGRAAVNIDAVVRAAAPGGGAAAATLPASVTDNASLLAALAGRGADAAA